VLVNFWTWTCINWLRQEPYVRRLTDAGFAPHGKRTAVAGAR